MKRASRAQATQEAQADMSSNDDFESANLIPDDLIEYIPEEKRGEFIREISLRVETYSGIIPHPSIVGRWESIMPGSADRILTLTEKHQENRMAIERSMFADFIKREQLGMWFYFVIALVMMIGGIIIILSGHSTIGLAALAAPLATIAGSFIYSQRHSGRRAEAEPSITASDRPKS